MGARGAPHGWRKDTAGTAVGDKADSTGDRLEEGVQGDFLNNSVRTPWRAVGGRADFSDEGWMCVSLFWSLWLVWVHASCGL